MRGGLLVMPVDDADSQREKRGHASRSPAPKKDTTKDMRSPQFARKSNVEPSGSPFPPLSSKKGAHGRSSSETNTLSNIDENTSLYLNPSPHRHHFAPQPLTPSFLLESDAVDDAQQQAMEILASLTSLGISTQLRQRVQEALSKELDKDAPQQSTSASGTQDQGSLLDSDAKPSPNSGPGIKAKSNISSATIKAKEAKEAAIKKQMTVEELEKKLTLSRSIMRKLYHKTVHLEKEVQLLKANSKPINDLRATGASEEAQFDSSSEALRPTTAMSTHSTISSSPLVIPSGIGPVGQAIQERDRTISQLQQALDASRRRCALLESQTPASSSSSPGSSKQQQQAIADLMAQSSLHLGKYKQIRDDYNSLLFKRSGAISSSKIASQATKDLVEDMQARLAKEIEEREAEAALYSCESSLLKSLSSST